MPEIKVTLTDGSTVIFHEEQTFCSVFTISQKDSTQTMVKGNIYGLWSHEDDGLIPSFLELLANSEFFFDVEQPTLYYSKSAIVKVEII